MSFFILSIDVSILFIDYAVFIISPAIFLLFNCVSSFTGSFFNPTDCSNSFVYLSHIARACITPSIICSGRVPHPHTYTSTGMYWSIPPSQLYIPLNTPPVQAQTPQATTTFGSGICAYISTSRSRERLVTGPVTSRISDCLGLPVLIIPKRSISYFGAKQASISMSHPLHPPAL